jgi:hypothetical protein
MNEKKPFQKLDENFISNKIFIKFTTPKKIKHMFKIWRDIIFGKISRL